MPLPPWVSLIPGPWPATDPDAVILDLAPAAWWRFHDGSYSDAGTTLCVADDPIRQVNDKSGNARHLVQATLGARPLWKPNILSGKAVGRLDGIDDVMLNTFGATLTQPNTIYSVSTIPSTNGRYVYDGLTLGARHWVRVFDGVIAFGSGTEKATTQAFNQAVSILTINYNAASSVCRFNGVQVSSGIAGTDSLTGITLGARYSLLSFFGGDAGELIVFNALHDAAQIAAVESRLSDYWGIAI